MNIKIHYQENNKIKTKLIDSEEEIKLPPNIIKIQKVKSFQEYFTFSYSSYDDVVDIFKELDIILSTNLSLGEAIDILLEGNQNEKINELLTTIKTSLQNAHPIDKSLKKHQKYIGTLPILFFQVGLENGNIKESINALVTILVSNQESKNKVINALTYPVILLITLLASITIIFTFVIPKFDHIFLQFGSNLPLTTQYLLSFKYLVDNYYLIIISIFILSSVLIKYLYSKHSLLFDKLFILNIPLIHQMYKNFVFYRLFLSIDMLINAKFQFQTALKNSKYITNNKFILYKINQIINDMENGKTISQSFDNTKLFNPLTIRLLHTAQQTNTLPIITKNLTNIYKQNLEDSIQQFSTAIGPIFIFIIASFILWIVLAIMEPIWRLGSVLN